MITSTQMASEQNARLHAALEWRLHEALGRSAAAGKASHEQIQAGVRCLEQCLDAEIDYIVGLLEDGEI